MREYQVCSNCVMDTSDSKIVFDDKGVCDHCRNFYENIKPNWHTDERGKQKLDAVLAKIKQDGKNKKYDCLIGLSGGVDSSFLAYIAKEQWGLRPLIYTVDVGWDLPVARENVRKIVETLGLDVNNVVIDRKESYDLQLAYFKSQVPYQDTPQDHAIFASLYNFAAKNKFKYIITGGNNATECVREPSEWVHVNDIAQIKDIHRQFGQYPLKNFPLCGMFKYKLLYRYFYGVKVVKALDYIPYTKEMAINALKEKFDWQPYANKHYESLFTRFYEGYWLVKKFGYDKRRAHYSSLILTGQMTREDGLKIVATPPYPEELAMQDMAQIADKMGISKDEFILMMDGENKTYKDYRSGKRLIDMAINLARFFGVERRNFR